MEDMDWENSREPPEVLNIPLEVKSQEPKMSEFTQDEYLQISANELEEMCQVAETVAKEDNEVWSQSPPPSPIVGYPLTDVECDSKDSSSESDPERTKAIAALNSMIRNPMDAKPETPKTKARKKNYRKRIKLRRQEEDENDEDRFLGEISTCALNTKKDKIQLGRFAKDSSGNNKNISKIVEPVLDTDFFINYENNAQQSQEHLQSSAMSSSSTASDKDISLAADTIEKDLWKKGEPIRESIGISNSKQMPRFATASGGNISISQESVLKAQQLWNETVITKEELQKIEEAVPKAVAGFSKANKQNVTVSSKKFKKPTVIRKATENNLDPSILNSGPAMDQNSVLNELNPNFQRLIEEDMDNDLLKSRPMAGFASASGKNISVSTAAMKAAEKLWKQTEFTENELENNSLIPKVAGFASASMKSISVSTDAMKAAEKLWKQTEFTENELKNSPLIPKVAGFASASGKSISVSTDAMKAAEKLWKQTEFTENELENNSLIPKAGFATASGRNISVSDKAIKKAQSLWEQADEIKNTTIVPSPGFATAGGRNISVSDKAIIKAQSLWEETEDLQACVPITNPGFSSASGKSISVSAETMNKAQKLWKEREVPENDLKNNSLIPKAGFASASGRNISVSSEAVKKAQSIWKQTEEDLQRDLSTSQELTAARKVSVSLEDQKKSESVGNESKQEVEGLGKSSGRYNVNSKTLNTDDDVSKEVMDSVSALLADEECDSKREQDEDKTTETEAITNPVPTAEANLPVLISSITYDRTTVELINVYIARIYSPIYLNKVADGKTVILTQKQFENQKKKQDVDNQIAQEKILSQIEETVRKQFTNKNTTKKHNLNTLTPKALEKMTGDEILDLMEASGEAASIESMMSTAMLNVLREAKYHREDLIRSAIQSEFEIQRKKLTTEQPAEVVKILVIDAACKDATDFKNSAFISIWRPSEALMSSIKEGDFYTISNLTTNSKVHKEIIQLNTTIRTRFQLPPVELPAAVSTDIFQKINRSCYTISDVMTPNFSPSFKEIDVVGLVVSVRPVTGNSGQLVYLSDENNNFLAIRFWNSITEQRVDDVLQQGTFISACNLQWRISSPKSIIPQAFFQETTTFRTNPKETILSSALNALKASIKNSKAFSSSSEMVLFSKLEGRALSGNSSFNSSFGKDNSMTPQTPTLAAGRQTYANRDVDVTPTGAPCESNASKRIKLLESYGEPPPVLALPTAKTPRSMKKFVPPRKK